MLEISLTSNIVEDINSYFTLFCCFLTSVWFDSQEMFGRDQILYCFYVLGDYHVTHPLWFYFRKSISWPYEKKTWKFKYICIYILAQGGARGKEVANAGGIRDTGLIPGLGRSPGGGNYNCFSTRALRISWTKEPGGPQFTGVKRVEHGDPTSPS